MALSAESDTVPFTAPPAAVTLSVSPSGSLSFDSRVEAATDTLPPSATVAVSSPASGASFTAVTLTDTVPVAAAVPSLSV